MEVAVEQRRQPRILAPAFDCLSGGSSAIAAAKGTVRRRHQLEDPAGGFI